MDTDFWHERWAANQIGFHQDEINDSLVRHWPELALGPHSRVLVPLCGKSRDMTWLRDQGHVVIGIEISALAVQAFFEEHGLDPELRQEEHCTRWIHEGIEMLCGDFFQLEQADIGTIDAFYDRAALIALPPAQRPAYARQLAGLLPPQSRGLLLTLDYNQPEMNGPPFAVDPGEISRLFGHNFEIDCIRSSDAMDANAKFRERGISRLVEHTYRMQRH